MILTPAPPIQPQDILDLMARQRSPHHRRYDQRAQVLYRRYCLPQQVSLAELGREYGVTREWVRQLEATGLHWLRQPECVMPILRGETAIAPGSPLWKAIFRAPYQWEPDAYLRDLGPVSDGYCVQIRLFASDECMGLVVGGDQEGARKIATDICEEGGLHVVEAPRHWLTYA